MKKPDSFEQACEMQGYDQATALPDVSKMPEHLQAYTLAANKRLIIAEAIKGGKHPGPKDRHWFPVFNSLGAFVFSGTDSSYTFTTLGARLDFNTETESDFFGENFADLHEAVMVIKEQ
ncbi:hypothetical protein [Mucilaginibacter sp.]|uniref:hypothetical protein n=1 Tax=Mucilaginibacter sp. TaxID=1882438 RepID=UPI003266381E